LTELKLKPGAQPPIPTLSFGHYLAPGLKHESGYYCGASYQLDDADTALRDSDQQANIDFLQDYFPGLFEVPDKLQGRTGFRAVSDDRMPVVGPVPDMAWFDREYHDLHHGRSGQGYASAQYLPGLYASAAHGSRGMTSCFLSAEVVAAEIESTPAPLEQDIINALNPARFIIRRLKRGG
jgi:tRNA 5-methylaminomethyl-2-thiouridine biosynthesis bifunctional protein